MQDIRESDWKLLSGLKKAALDRLCQEIVHRASGICDEEAKSYYERFMATFECIQSGNDDVARIFDGLKRSNAIEKLAFMRAQDLISSEEFLHFSEETRARVDLILQAIVVGGKFIRSRLRP